MNTTLRDTIKIGNILYSLFPEMPEEGRFESKWEAYYRQGPERGFITAANLENLLVC